MAINVWPTPPDASWRLVVCFYPDGELDLDFVHHVSRRFWSEDNGFLPLPEDRVCHFNRSWYEKMGFDIMVMMPAAQVAVSAPNRHLRIV